MSAGADQRTVLYDALELCRVRQMLPAPVNRRAIRERAGITQDQLAAAVGVSRQAVARWEAGLRSPRRRHLAAYSEALALLVDAVLPDENRGDADNEERPAASRAFSTSLAAY
jgi:transcriptional regulator with XRE-family HTH domain